MAIAEQEVTQEFVVRLTQDQAVKLGRAASAGGQSLEAFVTLVLLRAADEALTAPTAHVRPPVRSLDSVLGIFKNEPLMDALMERIREDRRVEIEALEAGIEAEAQEAEAQEAEAQEAKAAK